MDKTNIGDKLRFLREQTSFTQEEIAFKCDISTHEYNDYEIGKRYPSDTSLAILLEIYDVSRLAFDRGHIDTSSNQKSIINYIQIVLATLLILAFFLPFDTDIHKSLSGFQLMSGDELYFDGNVTRIVFVALFFQLLAHFLMYTNFRKFSNAFKTVFIFINASSLLLISSTLIMSNSVAWTLAVFIVLFVSHILITLYDLVKFPVEHDYLQDKGKTRRTFVLIANIVYGIIYISFLRETVFDARYHLVLIEWIMAGLWTIYHVGYIVMKKRLFESRLGVTLMLSYPPIIFAITMLILMIENGWYEQDLTFVVLFMFLPVVIVNIDYFLDMLRSFLKKRYDGQIGGE